MNKLWTAIKGFVQEEEGATATEYAVMLALIIGVAIATVIFLGAKVEVGFNQVATAIENVTNP
jgi:pilus assembly protein Flp/PilA